MRLHKFLLLVFCITFFSLLYVWQKTEIFRLAYLGQKRWSEFQDLLDKNADLRYNLKSNTSLVRIGSSVSASGDFQMPDVYWLVKLNPSNKEGIKLASRRIAKKVSLFSRIFSIKRQAEAKTINSQAELRVDGKRKPTINH